LGLYLYFVPVFAQHLGASFLDLGYIGAAAALTYAVAPFFVGQLADRMSHQIIYALAILINFASTASLLFSRTVNDVVINRGVAGLGFAFFWPITKILVLDLTRKEDRVKEMGRYSMAWGSAFLIGPFVGGIVVEAAGFFALFVISSLLSLCSFVGVILLPLPKQNLKTDRSIPTPKLIEQFHLVTQLFPWFCLLICYGLVFSIVTSIFPGYANSIGISAVLIGLLFTAFGMARVVTYASSERSFRFGERKALGLASILIAVGSALIILFPTFPIFLIAIPLMGGCFAIIFPLSIGLISRHFSEAQLGAAVGLYESTYGVGAAIGPILAGMLASVLDARTSFVTAGAAG
jgi:MFS family permease